MTEEYRQENKERRDKEKANKSGMLFTEETKMPEGSLMDS